MARESERKRVRESVERVHTVEGSGVLREAERWPIRSKPIVAEESNNESVILRVLMVQRRWRLSNRCDFV